MFIYICMYILGRKKIIQREGEFWHRWGGGVYGLKQPSMLDYLRNRRTRGRKGPYLPSNTCIYNAEKNILNERVAVIIYTRL